METGTLANDPFCYEAALHALIDALALAMPEDAKYKGKRPDIFSLAAQIAARGGAVSYKSEGDK